MAQAAILTVTGAMREVCVGRIELSNRRVKEVPEDSFTVCHVLSSSWATETILKVSVCLAFLSCAMKW